MKRESKGVQVLYRKINLTEAQGWFGYKIRLVQKRFWVCQICRFLFMECCLTDCQRIERMLSET